MVKHTMSSTTQQAYSVTEYRYEGASPNNYVTFNGENWRIIGVFDVNNGSGTRQIRLKIIRNDTITPAAWDTAGGTNWNTASLKTLLNSGAYYSRSGTYASTGLNATAKSMISNALWYIGGFYSESVSSYYVNTGYLMERSNNKYGSNVTSWIGSVGLMYSSDYAFATGSDCYNTYSYGSLSMCNASNWMRSYSGKYEWTLNVVADVSGYVPLINNNGFYSYGYKVSLQILVG